MATVDLGKLYAQMKIARQLLKDEPIEICAFGNDKAHRIFRILTAPHRRLRFLGNKTFGVALLQIPETAADPFRGKDFENLRRRRRRALNKGYTCSPFDPLKFSDQILAIHHSAPTRQGLPMMDDYLDPERVRRYGAANTSFRGVFDTDGVLRAYCHTVDLGGATHLARIMGTYDRLDNGIMYLLTWETALGIARTPRQHPHWLEYGSYIGGGQGLRAFKHACGYRPYRVTWRWTGGGENEPAA
jgi:hypothetical protein